MWNLNNTFDRLVSLMLAYSEAKACKDYDKVDQWRTWLRFMGVKVRDTKEGLRFEQGSYRDAFNRDLRDEQDRRWESNEYYEQLWDSKRNDKLYRKALRQGCIGDLFHQSAFSLWQNRMRRKVSHAYAVFCMRHLHYNWMRPFWRVKSWAQQMYYWRFNWIWTSMWESLNERRLTNTPQIGIVGYH